jgi:DUF1680 family protein
MDSGILRRDFLKGAVAAAGLLPHLRTVAGPAAPARTVLEPFDFHGVKLGASRWQEQYQSARDAYFAVSNDDILQGWRAAAGLPAPGKPLGGWCQRNSATVFGQWLSGMARMYKATDDGAMRDKAAYLLTEWAKTIKPDGDCGMRHYPYEKLVCGLVDMHKYAEHPDAIPLLEKTTAWASKTFSRENVPAAPYPPELHSGRVLEWYTLSENLFRAYEVTGNPKFKEFAEVWLYHPYWKKFSQTSMPTDAWGVHAYSHVNTFSSAAMAYAVSGDPEYLRIIKNAYDYLQATQCYATGGYGPAERIMPADGRLGRSLECRSDSFETPCGSWAGFKLSKYLMRFTGEARYGDWIERLFYNGVGAALPWKTDGSNFYYADYRTSSGLKYYGHTGFTCCSGTYIQDMADYHDLIYFQDSSGLYVNLFVPSEVTWTRPEGAVKLTQETSYPEADTTTLRLEMKQSAKFPLSLRVPGWARDMSVSVNGMPANVKYEPGKWATVDRTWASGDRVEARIPLRFRLEPIDPQHPTRVAIVRGPIVYVIDAGPHEPMPPIPAEAELEKWLTPTETPGLYRMPPFNVSGGPRTLTALARPFYAVGRAWRYRMYFENKDLPIVLW